MSPCWVENDEKKEKQGSWKSEGQNLGTTCCCQGEERRHDGDEQEGTIKTSKEERGIYEETPIEKGDHSFFLY